MTKHEYIPQEEEDREEEEQSEEDEGELELGYNQRKFGAILRFYTRAITYQNWGQLEYFMWGCS